MSRYKNVTETGRGRQISEFEASLVYNPYLKKQKTKLFFK